MKLSEKQKSRAIQDNTLILFNVDQKVKMKKEFESISGGYSIQGYVNSIRLDRNGVWYEVIYKSEKDGLFTSTHLLDNSLEPV